MSVHLKRDMDQLHRDILSMCALVEEFVQQAMEILFDPGYLSRSTAMSDRDKAIDQWDVRIEEECLKLLALHQPVAIDLRRITTVLKVCSELERVADLAVHICERASGIAWDTELEIPDKLKTMGKIAIDMLHRSIDAYVELDSQLAREVCAADDEVDELHREVLMQLREIMQDQPHTIESALNLFSACRHIERIADHATNIAEDIVYLVEGIIIRHRNGMGSSKS